MPHTLGLLEGYGLRGSTKIYGYGVGFYIFVSVSQSSIFCLIVWTFQTSARGFIPQQTLSIYLLRSLAIKFYNFLKQLVFMESFKLIIICIKL